MNDKITTIISYYVQATYTYIIFGPYAYVDLLTIYNILLWQKNSLRITLRL